MTEAEKNTVETPEPTLEEFVASMEASGDDEAGSDETQVDSEQPIEPEVEPEQMFDVNGEQVPISELIGGYMKGSDYTRKTQELAVKREEAESMRAAVDRFYESEPAPEWQPQPPAYGAEKPGLPEFATETERLLFEQNQKHEQALAALQNESKQRKQQEVLRSVDNTLFGFKDKHPDLADEQIVSISQVVRSKGLPYTQDSFDMVRKATMSPSEADVRKAAVAEYIAEQKALKTKSEQAALEPGNVPAADNAPPDIRNLSQETIDALAAEDFRQMMGG